MTEDNLLMHPVGKNNLTFMDDYVVVDTETTGLKATENELIEIGALRVRNGEVVETFSQLIRPVGKVPAFITKLTGITKRMLAKESPVEVVIPQFLEFVGDDVVLGHNVSFDMGFLTHNTQRVTGNPFANATEDTLRVARALVPKPVLPNHKLGTLAAAFNTRATTYHRALADCETTHRVYRYLKENYELGAIPVHPISEEEAAPQSMTPPSWGAHTSAKNIISCTTDFDRSHPLFARRVVFTGDLTHMTRLRAMQIVADAGGKPTDNVTFMTDLVVVGHLSRVTAKQTKAQEYRDRGAHLRIIDETEFLRIIGSAALGDVIPASSAENEMPF